MFEALHKDENGILMGCHTPVQHRVLISLLYSAEFVTHGKCDARPTVTFPFADHHHTVASTKIYSLYVFE